MSYVQEYYLLNMELPKNKINNDSYAVYIYIHIYIYMTFLFAFSRARVESGHWRSIVDCAVCLETKLLKFCMPPPQRRPHQNCCVSMGCLLQQLDTVKHTATDACNGLTSEATAVSGDKMWHWIRYIPWTTRWILINSLWGKRPGAVNIFVCTTYWYRPQECGSFSGFSQVKESEMRALIMYH